MRTLTEQEAARRRAYRVLRLADPQSVRWRALCAGCEAESAEVPRHSEAVIWLVEHGLATHHEHEVMLLAVFRLQGGEGTFGIVS